MPQKTAYYPLMGGLDLITPAIAIPPGKVIAGVNYEPHPGGYKRIDGFERFDGRPQPSGQSYWIVSFDAGSLEPRVGLMVRGATSGASGILEAVALTTGSWAGSDAAGHIVLRVISGTFQDNETLNVEQPTAFDAGFDSGFQ